MVTFSNPPNYTLLTFPTLFKKNKKINKTLNFHCLRKKLTSTRQQVQVNVYVIYAFQGHFFFFNLEITLLIEISALWEQGPLGWPATFPPQSTDSEAIFLEWHCSLQLCPFSCIVCLLLPTLLHQHVPDCCMLWLALPYQPSATIASGCLFVPLV